MNRYISSIDGLRALAVLTVVFFHVDFTWLAGGFIGVDVFFVLSGYLITKNISEQLKANNFSYSQFYQRRVARLFPALFVVIFSCLIVSPIILSPADIKNFSQSAVATSLSVSNFFFWSESGYFDQSVAFKPLLHTWSLSVEEQFYLVWPSCLFLLYKLKGRSGLIMGVIVISLLSFVSAYHFHRDYPGAVFYWTPFRIYQFGLGALIALLCIEAKGRLGFVLSVTSFLALLVSASFLDGSDSFLYTGLLPACLTVIFLIGANSPLSEKILGCRVFRWIGQRSYSIYLVHWPLMVYWKLSGDYEFSLFEQIGLVFLSLLLGYLLHKLVEIKFRFSAKFTENKKMSIVKGTMVFVVLNIVLAVIFSGKASSIFIDEKMAAYANLSGKWQQRLDLLRNGECNLIFSKYEAEDFNSDKCLYIDENQSNWLVLGDSYASGVYAILNKYYEDINFLQLSIPGCALRPYKANTGSEMCLSLYTTIYDFIHENKNLEGVVIASNWSLVSDKQLSKIVSYIQSSQKKVVIINQRARFKQKLPSIISSSKNETHAKHKANMLLKSENEIKAKKIEAIDFQGGELIDFYSVQCPKGECDIFDDDFNILYLDDSHFSLEGVHFFGKRLKKAHPDLFNFGS